MQRWKAQYAVAASAALLWLGAAGAQADEVLRWNRVATQATAAQGIDPLTESRAFAILHVAVHDALNSIDPRYATYGPPLAGAKNADPAAAAAAAAHDVLAALFPASRQVFAEALRAALAEIADDPARAAGVEVGRRAAARVLVAREKDGSSASIPYRPGKAPGAYRPTPPDFTPAFMSHWGSVAPFVLRSSAQFRPAAPPLPGSARARVDVDEVRRLGSQERSTRNAEQSEIARFWYESSPLGWNRIARVVAEERALGPWENARLFALVNLAMADGFIAGFEAKYHYNYWRPATAIREDGGAGWLSDLVAPPVPDYPSTHTVLGAAAAAVLARVFETDLVPFATTSGEPYAGLTRRFWSFSEAARENGASRVFAGIHFQTAVQAGYRLGDEVGNWAVDHALRPLSPTPSRVAARR